MHDGTCQKFQVDRSAIKLLQRLRGKYGEGSLRLRILDRCVVVLLSPKDVGGLHKQAPHPLQPCHRGEGRHFGASSCTAS